MSPGWLYWSPSPGFTIAWSGSGWLTSYDSNAFPSNGRDEG